MTLSDPEDQLESSNSDETETNTSERTRNENDHTSASTSGTLSSSAAGVADNVTEGAVAVTSGGEIQKYIEQTNSTLQGLQQLGDMSKLNQYNTLMKVMKDLRESENKLKAQLAALKQTEKKNENQCQENNENRRQENRENLNLENHENLYRENSENQYQDTYDNHGFQEIENKNEPIMSPERRAYLAERLARSQQEQAEIMMRLRESVARREDLMVRYRATRERLDNLKKQRREAQQGQPQESEEAESLEPENPIAGAESWSLEQVVLAITEFQALYDKVQHLQNVYSVKAGMSDLNDEDSQAEISRRMEELMQKKRLLSETIARLRELKQMKENETQTGEIRVGRRELPVQESVASVKVEKGNIKEEETQVINEEGSLMDGETLVKETETKSQNEEKQVKEGTIIQGNLSQSAPHTETVTTRNTRSREPSVPRDSAAEQLQSAAADVNIANKELRIRQEHLAALKQQLKDMKLLMGDKTEEEPSVAQTTQETDSLRSDAADSEVAVPAAAAESAQIEAVFVGVNGRTIMLNESERKDPLVISKFREMTEAKERLARMQHVMEMISIARDEGRDIREVLSVEELLMLEEAKDSADDNEPTAPLDGLTHYDSRTDAFEDSQMSDSGVHVQTPVSNSQEHELNIPMHQETGEHLSSSHLNGSTDRQIDAINSKTLWQGKECNTGNNLHRFGAQSSNVAHSVTDGGDVRQADVGHHSDDEHSDDIVPLCDIIAMQEELREKKNALEDLMIRMGKSSSFNVDNLSDNFSNISEPFEEEASAGARVEIRPRISQGATTRITQGATSKMTRDSTPVEHRHDWKSRNETAFFEQFPTMSRSSEQANCSNEGRPSCQSFHQQGLSQSGLFNYSMPTQISRGAYYTPIIGGPPKAVWQPLAGKSPCNTSAPFSVPLSNTSSNVTFNTSDQTQQTLNAALAQLSQVQETINNLQATLVHERNERHLNGLSVPGTPMSATGFMTPMAQYAGLGSLASNADGITSESAQLRQLSEGLQQCFRQLHLHSLEIEALSKHLQLMNQRNLSEPEGMEFIAPQTSHHSAASNCNHDEPNNLNQMNASNFCFTSNIRRELNGRKPFHQENCTSFSLSKNDPKLKSLRTASKIPYENRVGCRRDIYCQSGLEGSLGAVGGRENERRRVDEESLMRLDSFEDAGEEPFQNVYQNISLERDWVDTMRREVTSSDILNNQVPPGTRANNYWDNFRSYSRQNFLSNSSKMNTTRRGMTDSALFRVNHVADQCLPSQPSQSRGNNKRQNVNKNGNLNNRASARTMNSIVNVSPLDAIVNDHRISQTVVSPISNQQKVSNHVFVRNHQNDFETEAPLQSLLNGSGNARQSNLSNEVKREAETLIKRQKSHPDFLLQLFRCASQITSEMDQHVAVSMLTDLTTLPQTQYCAEPQRREREEQRTRQLEGQHTSNMEELSAMTKRLLPQSRAQRDELSEINGIYSDSDIWNPTTISKMPSQVERRNGGPLPRMECLDLGREFRSPDRFQQEDQATNLCLDSPEGRMMSFSDLFSISEDRVIPELHKFDSFISRCLQSVTILLQNHCHQSPMATLTLTVIDQLIDTISVQVQKESESAHSILPWNFLRQVTLLLWNSLDHLIGTVLTDWKEIVSVVSHVLTNYCSLELTRVSRKSEDNFQVKTEDDLGFLIPCDSVLDQQFGCFCQGRNPGQSYAHPNLSLGREIGSNQLCDFILNPVLPMTTHHYHHHSGNADQTEEHLHQITSLPAEWNLVDDPVALDDKSL